MRFMAVLSDPEMWELVVHVKRAATKRELLDMCEWIEDRLVNPRNSGNHVTARVTTGVTSVATGNVNADTLEDILGPEREAILAAIARIGYVLLPKKLGSTANPKPKRDMAAYMRARRAKEREAKRKG